MGQQRRARSAAAKEARRAVILAAARAGLEEIGFTALTTAAVARRARVAKGTVFLYFPTREALFLDVLDEILGEWLGSLHDFVARESGVLTPATLAAAVVDSLARRPALTRLLPLAASLEHSAAADRAAAFRHRLLRRLFGTGALVEQRMRLARSGDGVRALLYAYAIIVGLPVRLEAAEPARGGPLTPGPQALLAASDDLRTALTVLLNGFQRKPA